MTDTAVKPTGFTFPGPEHRGVFLGLRIPQTVALGAGVLWAVAAMVMIPSGLGLLIGAVFAFLGAAVAGCRPPIGAPLDRRRLCGAVTPLSARSSESSRPVQRSA